MEGISTGKWICHLLKENKNIVVFTLQAKRCICCIEYSYITESSSQFPGTPWDSAAFR